MTSDNQPKRNTDREIWRKVPGDYYSPSIRVTESGGIGICVGGTVCVRTIEQWHASFSTTPEAPMTENKTVDRLTRELAEARERADLFSRERDEWKAAITSVAPGYIPSPLAAKTAIGELKQLLESANQQLTTERTARLAAEAACAEMRESFTKVIEAIAAYFDEHGVQHEDDCPEDDACDCPLVTAITTSLVHACDVALAPTAGQSILERLDQLATVTAERDRLKDELARHLVVNQYDYPGDSPELVGHSCLLCGQDDGHDGTLRHKPECPLYDATTEPTP